MMECGKCGAKIPRDRVRFYYGPKGDCWKYVGWCEGCNHLLVMRRTRDGDKMSLVKDPKRVQRFAQSLPLKPEIQRTAKGPS